MRIDIVRNKYDIIHLDKLAGQFVLDNFGTESECVWGIWLDREIIGYCTLGFAEGVLKNANYTVREKSQSVASQLFAQTLLEMQRD